ncbi:MAG: acyl carrier protein [Rhodospirillales bacterium]|nr:acyl carrier protein [Rhodospirillales bacterium]
MLKSPFDLVADALGCSTDSLSDMSALNAHPMWDSLGHLNVMMALEEHYGVCIDDDGIRTHQSMAGIIQTYKAKLTDSGAANLRLESVS